MATASASQSSYRSWLHPRRCTGWAETSSEHWMRFREGLVVEHWANRDDFGTAEQLGWAPPSPVFLFRRIRATRRARRRLSREQAAQRRQEGRE